MLLGLTVLAIWLFSSFVYKTIKELGYVPESMSQTYYALDKKGWHFVAVLFLEAIILASPVLYIPWGLTVSFSIKLTVWISGLISLFGIGMVSSSPEFKTSSTQYTVHYIGSIIAMIGSQVYVFFVFPWAFLFWILVIGWKIYTVIHKHNSQCSHWEIELFEKDDWLWWMELGIFGTIFTTLVASLI